MSAIDKMTVISTDGASKPSRTITDNVAQGMELLSSTTGVDLAQLLGGLTAAKTSAMPESNSSNGKIEIVGWLAHPLGPAGEQAPQRRDRSRTRNEGDAR